MTNTENVEKLFPELPGNREGLKELKWITKSKFEVDEVLMEMKILTEGLNHNLSKNLSRGVGYDAVKEETKLLKRNREHKLCEVELLERFMEFILFKYRLEDEKNKQNLAQIISRHYKELNFKTKMGQGLIQMKLSELAAYIMYDAQKIDTTKDSWESYSILTLPDTYELISEYLTNVFSWDIGMSIATFKTHVGNFLSYHERGGSLAVTNYSTVLEANGKGSVKKVYIREQV